MFFGWMCFNALFYGLLTWMPNYLSRVHGFDIKQMGGAVFVMFFAGFVGELFGGWIADKWKAAGAPEQGVAHAVRHRLDHRDGRDLTVLADQDPVVVVVLLSVTLFFLRWCGLFWCIPSILGTRNKVGFLGGTMNLGGNIAGIGVPIVVGADRAGHRLLLPRADVLRGGWRGCSSARALIDYSRKIPV